MHEGSELMVDVSVALAWVAISGVSLKWLSVFGCTSVAGRNARQAIPNDEDLMLDEIYPLESFPTGDPPWCSGPLRLPVSAVTEGTPAHAAADVDLATA